MEMNSSGFGFSDGIGYSSGDYFNFSFLTKNRNKLFDNGREFKRIFNVSLNKYIDPVTGFDIIAFDDDIVKSGDGCMKDAVKEKWGDDAVNLILNLLK